MLNKLREKAKQVTQNLSILYIAYKRKDVPIIAMKNNARRITRLSEK
jgi:hypothetical protein